jgi:hypothetical protein
MDQITKMGGMGGKAGLLHYFMKDGAPEVIEPMLKDTDLFKDGPELLVSCVKGGNYKVAELLISRGVPCINPPETVNS